MPVVVGKWSLDPLWRVWTSNTTADLYTGHPVGPEPWSEPAV